MRGNRKSLNRSAKSERTFGEYGEAQAQFITMHMECGRHQSGLYVGFNAIEPDQEYSRVRQPLTKNQLAEIFVGSHQNPPGIQASIQHSVIVNPGRSLGDKYDVVAVGAE